MQRGISTPVGTNTGQVFIYDRSDLTLSDPKAPLLFAEYMEQAKAKDLAKKKEKQKSSDDLKKFMDDSPEYWYRHEKEIQDQMDSVYNMGAEIIAAGADPFSGTDQASIEFRRKKDRAEKLAKYSIQLKELHGEYFKKIDAGGKDGEKYTAASKQEVAKYFETPLNQLIDENKEPPRLEMEEPAFSLLKYDSDMAKVISGSKADGVSDNDILAFAAKSLEDPDVNDAVYSQIQRLSPGAQKSLETMAKNEGMTPEHYWRFQQMKPHFQDPTDAFDFTKIEKQMAPGLSSSSIEEGDITKKSVRLNPKKAEEAAELIVTSNPKYVQAGVKSGRFGSPSNTFDENMAAAIDWNKQRLLNMAKTEYSVSEDEAQDSRYGGYSRQEYITNREKWLETIRTGNNAVAREAGDYLKGVKLEDGSIVERVVNVSGTPGDMMNQADAVIQLQTVRTYKEDGEIKEERNTVDLERGYATDEFLFRLHDQAFGGPAKKQMFGQKERTVTRKGPYIPGSAGKQEEKVPAYRKILNE